MRAAGGPALGSARRRPPAVVGASDRAPSDPPADLPRRGVGGCSAGSAAHLIPPGLSPHPTECHVAGHAATARADARLCHIAIGRQGQSGPPAAELSSGGQAARNDVSDEEARTERIETMPRLWSVDPAPATVKATALGQHHTRTGIAVRNHGWLAPIGLRLARGSPATGTSRRQ